MVGGRREGNAEGNGRQNGHHRQQYSLPSAEEEKKLFFEYHQIRSPDLRNQLVHLYSSLVHGMVSSCASRLPRTIESGDLLGAGFLGLIVAVEDFDVNKGIPFEHYARVRIKGHLRDELRQEDYLHRGERRLTRLSNDITKTLTQELQRSPTDDEIRAATPQGLGNHDRDLLRVAPRGVFQHQLYSEDDIDSHPFWFDLYLRELEQIVLHKLTKQELLVFAYHYYGGLPYREIGERMGICESRVCRIHNKALERLRRDVTLVEMVRDVEAELAAA